MMLLYEIIFNDLLIKIKTGYYQINDLLPPESEMENMYSVSRAPVRQALAKLENLKLIKRERGKGTRVTRRNISDIKYTMHGFGEQLVNEKKNAYVKTKKVEEVQPAEYISEILKISNSATVVKTTRVRYVQEEPIFFLEHYCALADVNKVIEENDIISMRTLLREKFGLNTIYVSEEIEAVLADKNIAIELGIKTNYPLLKVMRIAYNFEFDPLEYMEYYVKSENWHYKVLFNENDGNSLDS